MSVHLQACLRGNVLELGGSVGMSCSIAGSFSMPDYASFYVAHPMWHQTCSRYGGKARFSRLRARSAELGFPCNSNEQHGIRASERPSPNYAPKGREGEKEGSTFVLCCDCQVLDCQRKLQKCKPDTLSLVHSCSNWATYLALGNASASLFFS